MGFTAAGMKTRYESKLAALDLSQTDSAAGATPKADAVLLALFEAVAEEIQANARATGTDNGGDSHSLNIE